MVPLRAIAVSPETADKLLCSAELIVIAADAKLATSLDPEIPRASGLRKRLGTALSTLAYLCRRVPVENFTFAADEDKPTVLTAISGLRKLYLAQDMKKLAQETKRLSQLIEFDLQLFRDIYPGSRDEKNAGALYRSYCHSCHQVTVASQENPALSLFDMVQSVPRKEFLARMLLGVRGTPEIGLSNPLTLQEMGAMTRYFEQGNLNH